MLEEPRELDDRVLMPLWEPPKALLLPRLLGDTSRLPARLLLDEPPKPLLPPRSMLLAPAPPRAP